MFAGDFFQFHLNPKNKNEDRGHMIEKHETLDIKHETLVLCLESLTCVLRLAILCGYQRFLCVSLCYHFYHTEQINGS